MQIQGNLSNMAIPAIVGTLFSLLASLHAASIIETIVLAVIGTVTSFIVSLTLKWLIKRKT